MAHGGAAAQFDPAQRQRKRSGRKRDQHQDPEGVDVGEKRSLRLHLLPSVPSIDAGGAETNGAGSAPERVPLTLASAHGRGVRLHANKSGRAFRARMKRCDELDGVTQSALNDGIARLISVSV